MNCQGVIQAIRSGSIGEEALAHLRSCPACLELAVRIDPDILFRSLGGKELTPPGGVDRFVGDVMQQVDIRRKEAQMSPGRISSRPLQWAVAAALGLAVTTATLVNGPDAVIAPQPSTHVATRSLESRPVIESYDSASATIVEVPSTETSVQIVMIFDDSLPVDL